MTSTLALSLALAFAPNAEPAKTRISEASLFKNGYAVVVREVDLDKSGTTVISELPNPTLGTFWVTASSGVKIKTVINGFTKTKYQQTADNMDALIHMNVGKEVTIDIANQSPVIGKILSESGTLVTVQTKGGTVTLFKSAIQRVTIGDGAKTTQDAEMQSRVLRLETEGNGKAYLVGLERGLMWVPAYSVDLSDAKKLKLVARATIVNDLGDLKNTPIKLITGFPNINQFGQDPFFSGDLNAVLGSMMSAGMPGGQGGRGFGGQMSQNSAPMPAMETSFDAAFNVPTPDVEKEGDLSFLKLAGVNLGRGERSYNVLFTLDSEYDHVYTWDIPDSTFNNQYTGINGPQEVWHSVKFKNTSGQPLTTATAMTWSHGNIVGQGMVNYTPNGSDVTYPINKALDVAADASEEEVDRKVDALQLRNGQSFDLVKIKGSLTLQNRKSEDVKVRVKKDLTGEMLESGEATVSKVAKGIRDTNSQSVLKWEKTVPTGKTVTLTYTYQVYVRR